MQELKSIIFAYDQAIAAGKKTALATVVHVEGSSYRRPGARMLVDDEGMVTGAISGGCLEGDALRKALFAISQQVSRLVSYDTSNEEDVSIGIQLGCEGIIQVLFEPIDSNDPYNPIELIRMAIAERQYTMLGTIFKLKEKSSSQMGTCCMMSDHFQHMGSKIPEHFRTALSADMKQLFHDRNSSFQQYNTTDGDITVFFELIQPVMSLVIVGAGNDAIPMMNIANQLGWDVRVVDGRNTHARPERFTAACQVLVSHPEKVLEQIPMDTRTACVMMTHNYQYDKLMLKALLPLNIAYIGMLGPRKKLDRMLKDICGEGFNIQAEMLEKVYGPTGLEIGAETPEEIALSIIAEIQAVINAVPGGSLKFKSNVIHDRTKLRIENKSIH